MTKRVYREVHVSQLDGGYRVLLDRIPVRSLCRKDLKLVNEGLARAVALEWADQGEKIDTSVLRLTMLAGRATDLTDEDRARIEAALIAYIETDLVCYRAEGPPALVRLQCAAWDPMVEWAKKRYSCAPSVTTGVLPTAPDTEVSRCYTAVVADLTDEQLVGLQEITAITGSLIVALALLEGEIDSDRAWYAGNIDEDYNISRWSEDAEAADRRARQRADLDAVAFYLAASGIPSATT